MLRHPPSRARADPGEVQKWSEITPPLGIKLAIDTRDAEREWAFDHYLGKAEPQARLVIDSDERQITRIEVEVSVVPRRNHEPSSH